MADFETVIANNVRGERSRRRWRQADLAEHLGDGWSESMVGDLETGRRKVWASDLPQLCRAFGIDLARLVDGVDPDDLEALGV